MLKIKYKNRELLLISWRSIKLFFIRHECATNATLSIFAVGGYLMALVAAACHELCYLIFGLFIGLVLTIIIFLFDGIVDRWNNMDNDREI